MKIRIWLLALLLLAGTASAAPLNITLNPDPDNPTAPQMGDRLSFHSVIRNTGARPADGVMAWFSLVRIDPGNEQPVDLEDWSAHAAATSARLDPSQRIETDWPLRLIQAGRYRVLVNAVSRSDNTLATSPFVEFAVRQKPVVESQRVLPVAAGVPLLLGGLLLWRRRH